MGERWSRLGGYMAQLCREGISGCACLVYEGEAERFRRYCGLRDVERGLAPDGDTLYRIYSLTKLYTAVAILQLLEAGKLHMEDPVAEYLPEYRSLQVNEVAANGWNEEPASGGPSPDHDLRNFLRLRQRWAHHAPDEGGGGAVSQGT